MLQCIICLSEFTESASTGGRGNTCEFNGSVYYEGESFLNDCNLCHCEADGNVRCSDHPCPKVREETVDGATNTPGANCFLNGAEYNSGDTFVDGCMYCRCHDSLVYCKQRACPKTLDQTKDKEPRTQGCIYNGKHIKEGEKFTQDCNICQCTSGGKVLCEQKACKEIVISEVFKEVEEKELCFIEGNKYHHGDIFMEGCNECRCNSGFVSCEQKACLQEPISREGHDVLERREQHGAGCAANGNEYRHGHTFMDGCNQCRCHNGFVSCEQKACLQEPISREGHDVLERREQHGAGCAANGNEYRHGDTFMDGCNQCRCHNGFVSCEQKACLQEPISREGHDVLERRAQHGAGCAANGNEYRHGDTFMDGCNQCRCHNGFVSCEQKACLQEPISREGHDVLERREQHGAGCAANGNEYRHGDTFMDGCNQCRCHNGFVSCEQKACIQEPISREDHDVLERREQHGAGCAANGNEYRHGDTFMDGCNQCRCHNGFVNCERKACVQEPVTREAHDFREGKHHGAGCAANGNEYRHGDTFMDGCNQCKCHKGVVNCQQKACVQEPIKREADDVHDTKEHQHHGAICIAIGNEYRHGDTFMDGCNQCRCHNGVVSCEQKACLQEPIQREADDLNDTREHHGAICIANGNEHRHGDTFMDDCNECRCNNGRVHCQEKACPKPFKTVAQKEIVLVQPKCVLNHRSYQEGETFREDCNMCRCFSSGMVHCQQKVCPSNPTTHLGTRSDHVTCDFQGQMYTPGDFFMNECNQCRCTASGRIHCQMKACGELQAEIKNAGDSTRWATKCNFNGGVYRHGDIFTNKCDSCSCTKGEIHCQMRPCPKTRSNARQGHVCDFNGKSFNRGDRFMDECNRCRCAAFGRVHCQQKACQSPRLRSEGGSCTGHQGAVHEDGARFKVSCNFCHCSKGVVFCTKKNCALDSLYKGTHRRRIFS